MIRFSSDDFSAPNGYGGTRGPVITQADIEKFLASVGKVPQYEGSNNTLVYKDSQAYSELLDNKAPGETNILGASGLVSLPNLKVNAANITYQILNRPADCTLSALSPNDLQWCATYDLNNELIDVLNSFTPV